MGAADETAFQRQRLLNELYASKDSTPNEVAVIVTNHQMQSVEGSFDNKPVPIGGNIMFYASKYRIYLEGRYSRHAKLDISPHQSEIDTYFAINEKGFTDVEDE